MRKPQKIMLIILIVTALIGNTIAINAEHSYNLGFDERIFSSFNEGLDKNPNKERQIDSTLLQLKSIFPEIAMPNIETGHLNMALSTFNVETIENKYVLIDWSTLTTGYVPDLYLIERWTDNIGWVEIQRINGEQIEGKQVVFSYLDRNPKEGNSFYRLKNVDAAGSIYSTNVQSVMMYNESKYLFQQDIDKSMATLISMDKLEKFEKIQVFNMNGKVVNDKIEVKKPQMNKVIIKMNELETGMYIIKSNKFLTKVFKV